MSEAPLPVDTDAAESERLRRARALAEGALRAQAAASAPRKPQPPADTRLLSLTQNPERLVEKGWVKLGTEDVVAAWKEHIRWAADETLKGGFTSVEELRSRVLPSGPRRQFSAVRALAPDSDGFGLERLLSRPAHDWDAYRTPEGQVALVERCGAWPVGVSRPDPALARAVLRARIHTHSPQADAVAMVERLAQTLPADVVRFIDAADITLHLGDRPSWKSNASDPCADLVGDVETGNEKAHGQYFGTIGEAWVFDMALHPEAQAEIMTHELMHGVDQGLGNDGRAVSDSAAWRALFVRSVSEPGNVTSETTFVTANSTREPREALEDSLTVLIRPVGATMGALGGRATRLDLERDNADAAEFARWMLAEVLPERLRNGGLVSRQRPADLARAGMEPLLAKAPSDRSSADWLSIGRLTAAVGAAERDVAKIRSALEPLERIPAGEQARDVDQLRRAIGVLVDYLEHGRLPEEPFSATIQREDAEHAAQELAGALAKLPAFMRPLWRSVAPSTASDGWNRPINCVE